ncbi:SRPBCC family protein [Sediminicola luteus]|nr:SRPBCC domain-containing protein [Sediminicola luteus]
MGSINVNTMDVPADIVVERLIRANKQDAWRALTEKESMLAWFFSSIPDFKPKLGFQTQFVIKPSARTFTHVWKVFAVVPYGQIAYLWHYTEYEGLAEVSFTIKEVDGNVEVAVRNRVLEPFPTEIPEFTRESGLNGWHFFMDRLKDYLEGRPVNPLEF